MKNIEINIGNACNNECKFCMIDFEDKRTFIDFQIIKHEILRAKQNGFDSIGFLGGEFTLHTEALKIIKLCKLLGFKIVHIISNGRKYNEQKFVKKLIKNGANRFSVSIHSHNEYIDDYLTQRPGGYKEKILGLKNLLNFSKQGLINNPIAINMVINKLNYQESIDSLKFFKQMGILDFRLNYVWLHGRAQNFSELFLKYSDFLPYILKISNLAKQENIKVSFEGIPPCLIKDNLKKDFIGEYKDSNTQVVAYNNPEKSREEFNWQDRKKNEFKVRHEKCLDCPDKLNCDGVWRDYIDLYGWGEFWP